MTKRITSSVITEYNDWADEIYLIPHELIRRGLEKMVEVTQNKYFQPVKKWKVEVFFKWYNKYFYKFICEHHCYEDHILFPWIKTRCKISDNFNIDHMKLMKFMDEINKCKEGFFTDNQEELNKAGYKLNEIIIILKKYIEDHLENEEILFPELFRVHFTKQETDSKIHILLKKIGLEGSRMTLPWIIDCMNEWNGPEKTNEFLSKLPKLIQFLNWIWWTRNYKKYNCKLINSITSEPCPTYSQV